MLRWQLSGGPGGANQIQDQILRCLMPPLPAGVPAKGGKAIIFSAPSGSGKTTIVHHLLKNNPDLGFSISAATRDKRGRKEENGKDYYFLSPQEFKQKIDNHE